MKTRVSLRYTGPNAEGQAVDKECCFTLDSARYGEWDPVKDPWPLAAVDDLLVPAMLAMKNATGLDFDRKRVDPRLVVTAIQG